MSGNGTRNDRPKTGTKACLLKRSKEPDSHKVVPSPTSSSTSSGIEVVVTDPKEPVAKEFIDELQPNEMVGRRRLVSLISKNESREVWKASDGNIGSTSRCVIKFLIPNEKDPLFHHRHQREASIGGALRDHECIVKTLDTGIHKGRPYIVSEHLSGKPLSKIIPDTPMPPHQAMKLLFPVLLALDYAHEKNVVHRDVKPENIMVTAAQKVYVIDFGIAKVIDTPQPESGKSPPSVIFPESVYQTEEGVQVGTPGHMSPEQISNQSVDCRSDIFSIGILLYILLTGRHPLQKLSRQQMMQLVADKQTPMPDLRVVIPNYRLDLCNIVAKCLEKDREKRYPNIKALIADLSQFLPLNNAVFEASDDYCPWVGLGPLQETDRDRLCGRDNEIIVLVKRIIKHPVVMQVGHSGCGKTSLMLAGVVPYLRQRSSRWIPIIIRPGHQPMHSLVNAFLSISEPQTATLAQSLTQTQSIKNGVQDDPLLIAAALRNRAVNEKVTFLLIIDQGEEIFTQASWRDRTLFWGFISFFTNHPNSPVRIVISLRSDFLDRVTTEAPELMTELANGGLFFLRLPDRLGLQKVIEGPASRAGYEFEDPGIVDQMLDDLGDSQTSLSLIQTVLLAMWEKRDSEKKLLTTHSYEKMGGILGALNTHADRVLSELPVPGQSIARNLFLRLVTKDGTRDSVPLAELLTISQNQAEVNQIIERLVKARLLLVYRPDRAQTSLIELAHDSLVNNWDTLRRWLDEDQEDIRFLSDLRYATKQWENKNRSSAYLWTDDERVNEARVFRNRYSGELSNSQRAYLDQVIFVSAKTARRKRLINIAALAVLSAFALTCSVGIAIIAKSKTTAIIKAHQAQQAESRAQKSKLEALKQAKTARIAENQARQREHERAKAVNKLQQTTVVLEKKNSQLVAAIKREAIARSQAYQNYQKAIVAQKEAEQNASELTELLRIERSRNKEM